MRLLMLLARPVVVLLLGLFAAVGLAQGGQPNDSVLLAKTLVVVIAFLLFAVAVNDLADEAIDRVNLPGDPRRPLVSGSGTRREMIVVAVTSAVVSLGASFALHWPAPLIVGSGLVLALAYSVRPVRLSDRGALTSLLLPAGYVAVPYLSGLLAARGSIGRTDLLLMGGLYAGFIGRIVLKDFRDVRGDTLFGKRTFLVRHGRGSTCVTSAVFWVVGASALFAVRDLTPALVAGYAFFVAATLALLRALSRSTSARRDESLVTAVAIVGRGMLVMLFAHFAVVDARWTPVSASALLGAITLLFVGSAFRMARVGLLTRSYVGALSAEPPVQRPRSHHETGVHQTTS